MSLPFTHDQFLSVFGAYNSALWPAVVALWLLTAAGVLQLARGRGNSRFLAALLSIQWLWSGAVYHLGYFTAINPAARLFGIVFILEAALIAWFGFVGPRFDFVWGAGRGLQGGLGVFFTVYALAYPFLALASGLHWPRTPTFGVPCSTTLLTVGLLLSIERARLRGVSVIPLAWSVIAGTSALQLGVLPDLALLLGGAVLLVQLLVPRVLTGTRAA
jgi:hypothetical protein